jgi:hypothetical protein
VSRNSRGETEETHEKLSRIIGAWLRYVIFVQDLITVCLIPYLITSQELYYGTSRRLLLCGLEVSITIHTATETATNCSSLQEYLFVIALYLLCEIRVLHVVTIEGANFRVLMPCSLVETY